MNEVGDGIIADAAGRKTKGDSSHGFKSDPGDPEVDGLPCQMEAVRNNAPPFAEKQVVVSARSEAGDDMDGIFSPRFLSIAFRYSITRISIRATSLV